MNARFWLIALLTVMTIIAFAVIFSAVNDPEVDELNFYRFGDAHYPSETLFDQIERGAETAVDAVN